MLADGGVPPPVRLVALAAIIGVRGFFLIIDGVFFAANILKVVEGGWVPLVLGLALMAMMTIVEAGPRPDAARWKQDSLPLA